MASIRWRAARAALGAGCAVALGTMATGAAAAPIAPRITAAMPTVRPMPGKPLLLLGAYDLATIGYRADEYFLSGTASAFRPAGDRAAVSGTAPYTTRIVVLRPTDPKAFNGTVVVEWLNVTGGQDTPADWMVAHREMIREGYAYVGVTAQKVGVEPGGAGIVGGGVPLKTADPARYGTLGHPGDAYAFDIFSQAGAVVRGSPAHVLGPLALKHLLAAGESQSAGFLTTYVNAVDPVARVYDGFLIHSRFGPGTPLDGVRPPPPPPGQVPQGTRFRDDLRVPVMTVITETDLVGGRQPGYYLARRPDTDRLRVWEVAGTAHADNYLFGGAFVDSGHAGIATLAKAFVPRADAPGGRLAKPANVGLPHHYVVEAALAALNLWVTTGTPPPSTPRMTLASDAPSALVPEIARDDVGIATGGVRTPWVDVPTIRLTGVGNAGSPLAILVGTGEPLDAATLARLYPGGKADYLKRFTAALSAAIAAGSIRPADREEILAIAAANYPGS